MKTTNIKDVDNAIQVAGDVVQEAVNLAYRAPFEDGEFGIQTLAFGWVVIGTWYRRGGLMVGEPGHCWVIRRWRNGEGLGPLAHDGPSAECVFEPLEGGVRTIIPMGLPFFPARREKWGRLLNA
jgi:hypothetical protein